MSQSDNERAKEAREALDRVKRDEQGVLGSAMARAADHFAGKDAPPDDPAEIWGRRIGRSLSLIGVIVLGYLLGVQLKLW
jgi:hypothetical protein